MGQSSGVCRGETDDPELLRAALADIRERGRETMRSGGMIVMEYLFHALKLTEFEGFLTALSLACELDHDWDWQSDT